MTLPASLSVAIDARIAGYTAGGIAQYTLQLSRALALLGGARYTMLLAARPREQFEIPAGVATAKLWTPPHHRFEQWSLPIELARLRPRVLHSVDFIPPLRRRFRSVITVHDLAFLRYPETMTAESHRYYGQLDRAVRSAERFVAVSEATRADLIALLGADDARIRVIPHGLDPFCSPRSEVEQARVRQRHGLAGRFVLWVGTFEPRKNVPTLLRAFASMRDRDPTLTLALVGRRGWLDAPIFELIQTTRLGRGVQVLEGVPRADLPGLYSAAAAFAFPSRYEGFGLPILEAMACGAPVVAADVSSLPEVLGEAGLLVSPDDPDSLAEALRRVLDDPALAAELRHRGLARAAQFSWDRAARATLTAYREAAA